MSESRISFRQEAMHDTGGVLASSLTVAGVTAAIGLYFVQQAVWQPLHLAVSVISFLILASLVNFFWILRPGGPRFGEANQTTLLRSGLVCLIGSALLASSQEQGISWHLTGVIALALALDGVDGYLARRLNLASDFGARFDMGNRCAAADDPLTPGLDYGQGRCLGFGNRADALYVCRRKLALPPPCRAASPEFSQKNRLRASGYRSFGLPPAAARSN